MVLQSGSVCSCDLQCGKPDNQCCIWTGHGVKLLCPSCPLHKEEERDRDFHDNFLSIIPRFLSIIPRAKGIHHTVFLIACCLQMSLHRAVLTRALYGSVALSNGLEASVVKRVASR